MKYALVLMILVCVTSSNAAFGGPVLDRLLNQMVLDVSNGAEHQAGYKMITPEAPIGQTFTTGPNTVEICRIAIGCAYWNEEWASDESLVLTLWDSPAKTQSIASEEMPTKWKAWERAVLMFTLNAPVKPSTQYYFELTVKGGDGKITGIFHGEPYAGDAAYEGGKQVEQSIWFEVHSRRPFDKDKVYSDALSRWNSDYPGLEKMKAAVQIKEWDKAVDELIAFYEARLESYDSPIATPVRTPGFDRSYVDLVMDQKIKDSDGNIVDLGPRWNHYRTWPTRGGVGLTRMGIMGHFRGGYLKTADEIFATRFNDMMINVINDEPSPLRAGAIPAGAQNINASPPSGIGGGSMWGGLSIGSRINQMWYIYSGLAKSPNFTRDVRAAMIFNMVNMADVYAIQKGGGNWDTQMSSGLMEFADRQPELNASRVWFEDSLAAVFDNLWVVSRADGTTQEPTSNYHNLMLNRFLRVLETCKKKSIPVDPKYVRRVERIVEYTMFATQPDGNSPSTGDTFNFNSPDTLLQRGAAYFGRDDFLYVGTNGAQGKAPMATSARFPIGGWYVMRSDWTPGARYLYLHNGLNMGHGHADELEVIISAYGKPLIADPGCYIYGTPKQAEFATTKRHPTVSVDNADTVTSAGKSAWASMRTLDYYNGTNAGYKGLSGINHTRRIVFVKPGYWVMNDSVSGEGEHAVSVNFPFGLGIKGQIDVATGACHTTDATANILILPVPGSGFKGERYDTDFPDDGLQPAQGVRYTLKTSLPLAGFTTVLYPYKGSSAPAVSVENIAGDAVRVKTPVGSDLICFGKTESDELSFNGEALLLRAAGSSISSIAWAAGETVSYKGRLIASAASPVKQLELIYDGDTVTVIAGSEEPTLKIATLGAKWLRVGPGLPKAISGDYVEPFAK